MTFPNVSHALSCEIASYVGKEPGLSLLVLVFFWVFTYYLIEDHLEKYFCLLLLMFEVRSISSVTTVKVIE